MVFDPKEYVEAFAEAPVTAKWAAGAGACGGLLLALLASSLPELSASLKAVLGTVFAFGLVTSFVFYKRTRTRGLQRAEQIKDEFVAVAQAAAHNEIRKALDWIAVTQVICAEWNRVHSFVQVSIRIFSPALDAKEIRSVEMSDDGLTPICVQIILPGLQNFMVPLQTGAKVLSIGGGKGQDQVLIFRRVGPLPSLGLTAAVWASTAQFELRTAPQLQWQAMVSIVGEP